VNGGVPVSLPAREGYRLWAPRYAEETAVSALEACIVRALGVRTAGRALLDAGCGTARRLLVARAATRVGIDLVPAMLARAARGEGGVRGEGGDGGSVSLAAADVRALPLPSRRFDVVWCRLVLGHVGDLRAAYAELSRVCRPGGTVVVTDFHPDASAAGHRRTFRDGPGTLHELEHHVHGIDGHEGAARAVGLSTVARRDGVVGPPIRRFYAARGRLDAYEMQRGLALVLALVFRRAP
jgi:malonyl-CoA O-methyltransferase